MDQESKELVQAATEAGVTAFLRTVAAPLVEVGGWGGDLIRRRRIRTTIKTAVLAQQWLEEAGLEAHAVPLNLLVPILDGASLQAEPAESEDASDAQAMYERWAALLANAAAGGAGAEVMPSFPGILAELLPVEAAILELLSERTAVNQRMTPDVLRQAFGFPYPAWRYPEDDSLAVHLDNLERLRLCRTPGDRDLASSSAERIHLTALGRVFIAACRPPTGAQVR